MLKVALAALLVLPPVAAMERRRAEKTAVDRAIQKGITTLKIKPRVLRKLAVKKTASLQDNSNSSYAALGFRISGWPLQGTPAWLWNPACRLGQAAGAIQRLKDECWKGIVSASYSK